MIKKGGIDIDRDNSQSNSIDIITNKLNNNQIITLDDIEKIISEYLVVEIGEPLKDGGIDMDLINKKTDELYQEYLKKWGDDDDFI